jgi:hypothetical protein
MTKTAKVVATSKALIAKAGAEVAAMEPTITDSAHPVKVEREETLDERIDRGDAQPLPDVEHRQKPPAYPFLVGPGSRHVANQISHVAALADKSKPDSFEACIRMLKLVQVKNVHPNVGIYRAECIDWLEGRKAALK